MLYNIPYVMITTTLSTLLKRHRSLNNFWNDSCVILIRVMPDVIFTCALIIHLVIILVDKE